MSLSSKRLQRRIAADTAQLKARLSGQPPWDVIGMVDDLPVADDDPAALRLTSKAPEPAHEKGPRQGASHCNPHHAQQPTDGFGAPPRHESRR
jgi:hypothetical protein